MKFLLLLPLFFTTLAASAADVGWQSSSSVDQTLCIRDKNGDMGAYQATFSVIEVDSENVYTQTVDVTGDKEGCVGFPFSSSRFTSSAKYGFKNTKTGETLYSAPKNMGMYYWKADVNGKTVIKGKFFLGREVEEDDYFWNL